jgi:hypothetical protein
MQTRQRFTTLSLLVTLILNAVLLAVLFLLAGDAIQAAGQTVLFFAVGVVITLVLWFAISLLGGRLIDGAAAAAPPATETAPPRPTTPVVSPADRVRPPQTVVSAEQGAVQMLAILQRQGRLIDFLQEDLSMYDDAQIGAAVRNIHEGCRQALAQHVRLEPIFGEAEGSTVQVQPGFDPDAIRLTGEVVGEPPFRGELRHRGWRVTRIDLPQQAGGQRKGLVAAAAEVEVNG